MTEFEYWDLEVRMSKPALYKVLYNVIMCRGAITNTLTSPLAAAKLSPRQNAHNIAYLRIKLPTGERERFETLSGYALRRPPRVQVN